MYRPVCLLHLICVCDWKKMNWLYHLNNIDYCTDINNLGD